MLIKIKSSVIVALFVLGYNMHEIVTLKAVKYE